MEEKSVLLSNNKKVVVILNKDKTLKSFPLNEILSITTVTMFSTDTELSLSILFKNERADGVILRGDSVTEFMKIWLTENWS